MGGTPWVFAGLVAGAWELRDPLAPATLPSPGIAEAQVPLAWYDSASVAVGEGAAWTGFGAGLAVARGTLHPPDGDKPRAVFTSMSGTDGVDRNGVLLTHGNAERWVRIGAIAGSRGGLGALDIAADHLWTLAASRRAGAHVLEVGFAQRGMGESQRVGEAESGRGESGRVAWGWAAHGDSLAAAFARGYDHRAVGLIGLEPQANVPIQSRRDASERTLEIGAFRRSGGRVYGLRVLQSAARTSAVDDYPDGSGRQLEWTTRSLWFAASHTRPLGGGELEVALGAGHTPAADRAIERNPLAPSVAWSVDQGRQRVRVFAERIVDPVWSDLADGVRPFLQHTWTGGFSTDMGRGGPFGASVLALAGRTANRATLFRNPIRSVSLGVGLTEDAHRYNFLLLQGRFVARGKAGGFDASGFALARGNSSSQPRVDPALGGTAGLEGAGRVFAGDLGVRLRAEASYVGVRESDTRVLAPTGFPLEETLPGYMTFSATATLTLGDATIVLRGEGLEGVTHPLTWVDYATGTFARTGGRELRAEVVWPLFN